MLIPLITALVDLKLSFNKINNILFLEKLTSLVYLDLASNDIIDISILKDLGNLTELDLSGNQLTNISILQDLTSLTSLNLTGNEITNISILQDFISLTFLSLNQNPIQYIPKEIYEEYNCADVLKNYCQEIATHGKTTNNQLKIMFLGNGCVGKTTLLHWFIDNGFKDIPQDRRTEGIIIQSLPLNDGQVVGNFWDFGGQEVYHATHRLFLGKRTVYILVWATETPEKETELRHPPQYWLDMIADIQTAKERSTVLIVQNLFDSPIEKNLLTDDALQTYYERGLDIRRLTVNAKTGKSIKAFKAEVEEAVTDILNKHEEHLPTSWVNIREAMVRERDLGKKTLAWSDFEGICKDSEPTNAIDYLHRAGEVFYYPHQFDNTIILDQKWALDKVYAVLKSKDIAPYKGVLPLDVLLSIWQKEDHHLTTEEAKIFVNFMLGNQLMFYTEGSQNGDRKDEFVIPQLLDDKKPVTLKHFHTLTDALRHRIEYAFLHRDIIERFIVSTAHLSTEKQYWRNGLFISYNNSDALIEVITEDSNPSDYPKRWIKIQCVGQQKDHLLQTIREEFNKIRPLDKAVESVWKDNDWQIINDKIHLRTDDKSGFPERQSPTIDFEKAATKQRLKLQVAEDKVKEVLTFLIESNHQSAENNPYLLLNRWHKTQKDEEKGIITRDIANAEFNTITVAVLKMVDDMD